MKLNSAFLNVVSRPIYATWQGIAPDTHCEDNEEAIEMCIDADQLIICANARDADALIEEAVAEHGYDEVLSYLSRNIKLL